MLKCLENKCFYEYSFDFGMIIVSSVNIKLQLRLS